MKQRSIFYYLGNALMAGSVILFGYIYYPVIQLYSPKATQTQVYAKDVLENGYFIDIPKINAEAPIIANVNPWNPRDYLPALQKGVAEASGFATPGEPGIIFMFAHSSDLPWRMTRTNTAFFRLGELVSGDQIKVLKDGTPYTFTVKYTKEVWPDEVSVLKNLSGNWLVLQTCTPVGTSLKRLLVFAAPN